MRGDQQPPRGADPSNEADSAVPTAYALSSYAYDLPPELIAQTPAEPRDAARLLVLHRSTGAVEHLHIFDLPRFFREGDVIVANRSRVIPCRLIGHKVDTGGEVELLLLHPTGDGSWNALARGRRLRVGQRVQITGAVIAEIGEAVGRTRTVQFHGADDVLTLLEEHGLVPLPPYIHGYTGDPERYQTVYADTSGSAAAPTAGLHFTPELIAQIRANGVGWATVTLHIGLDTFRPMVSEDVREHEIHTEWIDVPIETVEAIRRAQQRGGRVIAIGTTTVRAIEHASSSGSLEPYQGPANLFITPGYRYRTIDMMLTNFHLPMSSLLLLVSAFATRELILETYAQAVAERYRFFSFGDAMLLV